MKRFHFNDSNNKKEKSNITHLDKERKHIIKKSHTNFKSSKNVDIYAKKGDDDDEQNVIKNFEVLDKSGKHVSILENAEEKRIKFSPRILWKERNENQKKKIYQY